MKLFKNKIFCASIISCLSAIAVDANATLFTFEEFINVDNGKDIYGSGAATLDIQVSGNTLTATIENTSQTDLNLPDYTAVDSAYVAGDGGNTSGIVSFGFFLSNVSLLNIVDWSMEAKDCSSLTTAAACSTLSTMTLLGDKAGTVASDAWELSLGTNVNGLKLDYQPSTENTQVKGALYNTDTLDDGNAAFGATPNYFTTGLLTIVFNDVPVLETVDQAIGSGLSGVTSVRWQNVGLDGEGSLKGADSGNGDDPPSVVPEPSILALFGIGLLGSMVAPAWRRRKS